MERIILQAVGGAKNMDEKRLRWQDYAQRIFYLFGYRVIRAENLNSFVRSDYKRFETDDEFMEVYDRCWNHTLVDVLRLHELWTLVEQTKWLEDGDYLEVGVWRGGSAAVIATKVKEIAPESTVYLADTFEGVVKATDLDGKFVGGELSDTSETIVKDLLKMEGLTNCEILKGVFPEETGPEISSKIRFLHIDVVTYEGTRDIVRWAEDRLVKGGFILFDDYGFLSCDGVTRFVEEEFENNPNYVFVHNINGHGIAIKR